MIIIMKLFATGRGVPATLTLLCAVLRGVVSLTVEIPQPEYEFARGDNITLPCSFITKEKNPNLIVISWKIEGLQAGAEDILILSHYYPAATTDIKNIYEGRVSLDVDVPKGKANLKLNSITLADNKRFECRVMVPNDDEGTLYANTRVVVLVAPSTPICKIQGKAEYGQNINLTCHSEEGSPPPEYSWESFDVRNQKRIEIPGVSNRRAIKPLLNISRETSGFYVCTSKNKIRAASCNITLAVMPPSMNVGSTAGIIVGVIAALIVLIVVVYCCCCRKTKQEKEYAMGVRQDDYHDKESDAHAENRRPEKEDGVQNESSEVRGASDRRDQYEDRSEGDYDRGRDYDDRGRDRDDRGRDYDDRGRDRDDRRRDYDDRRVEYNDRPSDYDDRGYDDRHRDSNNRRSDYDERASDYENRRDQYSDRRERYDDDRRYEDERRYDDRREHD